jgi:hypothetical protein
MLAIGIAALSQLGAASSQPPIGTWSNVQVTKGEDPHASGIEVEIRRHNGELVGFVMEYVGPVADPPVGKLESIRFDEKTGSISFASKLSVGVVPAAAGNAWVPSRNLYEFKGVIGGGAMKGSLRRKFVEEDGKETAYDESITLTAKSTADDEPTAEWMKRWNDVLKTRGPKW